MWEYLARNLKADVNILVLLTCESTETGAVTQRSLYRNPFNQNGMDFVTKISFCKTLVVDEKTVVDFTRKRGWKSIGKSFKVSVSKLRRQTHSHNLWLLLVLNYILRITPQFCAVCRHAHDKLVGIFGGNCSRRCERKAIVCVVLASLQSCNAVMQNRLLFGREAKTARSNIT